MSVIEETIKPNLTMDEVRAEFAKMSDTELQVEFAKGMRLSKDYLLRLGVAVVEMEKRGIKVQAKPQYVKFLREIGTGKLLVELAVEYGGQQVLSHIRSLPVEEQRELIGQPHRVVNERFRKRPMGKGHLAGTSRKNVPALANLAKDVSVAEAVAMCMEVIENHPYPEAVACSVIEHVRKSFPAALPECPSAAKAKATKPRAKRVTAKVG